MSFVSIASSLAIVLGFSGTLPHIRTMLRTRSSDGQSALGWSIGITVNALTGYVNLFGIGAVMLGIGNVLAGTFSTIALLCVLRFRRARQTATTPASAPVLAVHELPTHEFHAIKSLVDEEHARRERSRVARATHAEAEAERADVEQHELQPAFAAA